MTKIKNGTMLIGQTEIPFLFDKEKDALTVYFGGKTVEVPEDIYSFVGRDSENLCGYTYYELSAPITSYGLAIIGTEAKQVAMGNQKVEVEYYIEKFQPRTVYNVMKLQFAELNYLLPSCIQVENQDEKMIFSRKVSHIYQFDITYCSTTLNISFDTAAKGVVAAKSTAETISEVTITFPETNDLNFITDVYVRVRNFFSFVCNRKNIGLRGATLCGKYPTKKPDGGKLVDIEYLTTQDIFFSQKYLEPMEPNNKISKVLNIRYFSTKLKELLQLFFECNEDEEATVNDSSIHHSFKYRNLIDLEQSLHITATFEHYVKSLLPEMSSTSTVEFIEDMKEFLDGYISDTSKSKKKREKAKDFQKGLAPQISLKDKIKKVYKGYSNWQTLSEAFNELFEKDDIPVLAKEANDWRNELAHDKREYVPNINAIKAIRLLEHINYAIVLRQAGYSDEEINYIIKEILVR